MALAFTEAIFKNNRFTVAYANLTNIFTFIRDSQTSRSLSGMWTNLCLNALFHAVQIVNNTLPYGAKPQACSRASFPRLRLYRPTLPHYKLLKSHLKPQAALFAFILYSWWTGTRVYSCRLSVNCAPPAASVRLVSSGVNTPGETNRWMT